jgi:hypothetical protein
MNSELWGLYVHSNARCIHSNPGASAGAVLWRPCQAAVRRDAYLPGGRAVGDAADGETRGAQAANVFYVLDASGEPIEKGC